MIDLLPLFPHTEPSMTAWVVINPFSVTACRLSALSVSLTAGPPVRTGQHFRKNGGRDFWNPHPPSVRTYPSGLKAPTAGVQPPRPYNSSTTLIIEPPPRASQVALMRFFIFLPPVFLAFTRASVAIRHPHGVLWYVFMRRLSPGNGYARAVTTKRARTTATRVPFH